MSQKNGEMDSPARPLDPAASNDIPELGAVGSRAKPPYTVNDAPSLPTSEKEEQETSPAKYVTGSSYLGGDAATNLVNAILFADSIGTPLNRHLIILWEDLDIGSRVQPHQVGLLERMSKWLKYHDVQPAYVWVVEIGPERGRHSHILVHVPLHLLAEFKRMVVRWLPGGARHDTVKVKSVRYPEGPARMNRLAGITRYLLKGVEPGVAAKFGVNPIDQGQVPGKRAGTSRNIGRASRERCGWSRPMDAVAFPALAGGPEREEHPGPGLDAEDEVAEFVPPNFWEDGT